MEADTLRLYIPIQSNFSFAMYYKNRLWRTEVNAKKRERTRQQAAEMKEMQKFLLIKVGIQSIRGVLTGYIYWLHFVETWYAFPLLNIRKLN